MHSKKSFPWSLLLRDLCRIHDLLRDLCVSKAREENFFGIVLPPPMNENKNHSLNLTVAASKVRRIVVHPSKSYVSLKGKSPNLHSLLLFQDEELIRLRISKCSNFRFLRVLKLLRKDSAWFIPSEIGNLFHLRNLALKCSQVILPRSIGNLKSLHTLLVQVKYPLLIPNVLFKLERLRHLLFKSDIGIWHRMEGCHGVNSLENIETLKYIRVDNLSENNALLKLTNIRSLGIQFKRVKDIEAILRSPIFVLGRLQSLHMDLESIPYPNLEPLSQCHHLSKLLLRGRIHEDPHSSHHVLEFLPKNIVKLTLSSSFIKKDPMAVLEKLPHLRSLWLWDWSYVGTKFSCSANGFPQLDYLHIDPSNCEEWQIEEGAMPSLRILKLGYASKLKMIPEGLKYMANLQEMELYYTKKSLVKRIQVIDGREREDYYKVRHIPSIKILSPEDD